MPTVSKFCTEQIYRCCCFSSPSFLCLSGNGTGLVNLMDLPEIHIERLLFSLSYILSRPPGGAWKPLSDRGSEWRWHPADIGHLVRMEGEVTMGSAPLSWSACAAVGGERQSLGARGIIIWGWKSEPEAAGLKATSLPDHDLSWAHFSWSFWRVMKELHRGPQSNNTPYLLTGGTQPDRNMFGLAILFSHCSAILEPTVMPEKGAGS